MFPALIVIQTRSIRHDPDAARSPPEDRRRQRESTAPRTGLRARLLFEPNGRRPFGQIAARLSLHVGAMCDFLNRAAAHVLLANSFKHLFAPVVEPLRLPAGPATKCVGSDERKANRRVEIANNAIWQTCGIDLAPAHRLARSRPAQAAGVGTRIRALQESSRVRVPRCP